MKLFWTIITLLFFITNENFGQDRSNKLVEQFQKSFNSGNQQASYLLFSDEFKAQKSPDEIKTLIESIRNSFGTIKSYEKIDSLDKEISRYRLFFEKSPTNLIVIFKRTFIIGIAQDNVRESSQGDNNFYIETTYGKVFGTLTLPSSESSIPVVLLIAGSGPTDRNMNQGNTIRTDAFLMLAKKLAECGIASVRFDKRGIGASVTSQSHMDISFDTYVHDVSAFTKKLQQDRRFSKVIVAGHSEGAAIGLISSLSTTPSGFISISGYAKDLGFLLETQLKGKLINSEFEQLSKILSELRRGKTPNLGELPTSLTSILNAQSVAYVQSTLKYNSSDEIKKLKIPSLIIGGTSDLQIPISHSEELSIANKKGILSIIPGMNHVLKQVNDDVNLNQKSYFNPEVELSNQLVDTITKFITSM